MACRKFQGRPAAETAALKVCVGVWLALPLLIGAAMPARGDEAPSDQVQRLQREIDTLKARLARMEALVVRLSHDAEGAAPARTAGNGGPGASESAVDVPANGSAEGSASVPVEVLASATPGSERPRPEPKPAKPKVDLSGALRFNAYFRDFARGSETKRGESGLDLFRLGVDGEYRHLLVSAEYRWYPYMSTLHHGWVGYRFDQDSQIQVGVQKVPFGLLPYASHNYWFGVPYYLGLSDDYDLGVKYLRKDGAWDTRVAFYKSEEQGDATSLSRYGFDLVRSGKQQNEEVNRFNVRVARTFGAGTGCENELGLSGQRAQLYNAVTDRVGSTWAAAAHVDSRCGRWNLQLETARYAYHPDNPPGVADDVVRLGAFETSYLAAADGDVLVTNLAYNFPVPWPAIDQITCYNDYSRLFKHGRDFEDSQIDTTGCLLAAGALFTYLDVIRARNMPLFQDGTLGPGGNRHWDTRINLNVGYYW